MSYLVIVIAQFLTRKKNNPYHKNIMSEDSHILNFVIGNGNIYASGSNYSGEAGFDPIYNTSTKGINRFTRILIDKNIIFIANFGDTTAARLQ